MVLSLLPLDWFAWTTLQQCLGGGALLFWNPTASRRQHAADLDNDGSCVVVNTAGICCSMTSQSLDGVLLLHEEL